MTGNRPLDRSFPANGFMEAPTVVEPISWARFIACAPMGVISACCTVLIMAQTEQIQPDCRWLTALCLAPQDPEAKPILATGQSFQSPPTAAISKRYTYSREFFL